jgi:diguanylate cyclase (GGDEF)-like protein
MIDMEQNLQTKLEKARSELYLLYEIGNAMRSTLVLEEILYIILTSVTAHVGLGFNRAMLFLVDPFKNILKGEMGIGPDSPEQAEDIWARLSLEKKTLDDFISSRQKFKEELSKSKLNKTIRNMGVPLNEHGGILALTAMERMPFEITTQEAREKLRLDPYLDQLKLERFVTVPLEAKDTVIGIIVADNIITDETIEKDDVKLLTLFANQAGLAIENARLYERTLLMSYQDSLTRLWNHGYFQYLLSLQISLSDTNKKPVSLIVIDIDNFKNYNDKIGHPAGDEVLKQVAEILKTAVREGDIVARYGGEEFVCILPDTNKDTAAKIAERLRIKIENHRFQNQEIQPLKKITISAGIATYPDDADGKKALISCADTSLYTAKNQGKNKVVGYVKT